MEDHVKTAHHSLRLKETINVVLILVKQTNTFLRLEHVLHAHQVQL